MRVPLKSIVITVQSQNISPLAPVILQPEGHLALASDPLIEDTSVSVNPEGRKKVPTF